MRDMCDFWARYTISSIFDEVMGWETQNLLTLAALMSRAAEWRRETRGGQCRVDYPKPDGAFAVHATWMVGHEQPIKRAVGHLAEVRA
jgi:L-aspartate oxidase